MSGYIEVPIGYEVDGWRVTELIGNGAWGSVYAAESEPESAPTADRPERVALKFLAVADLSPGQSGLWTEIAHREAEFSLRADHPHLVRTLDVLNLHEPGNPELNGALVLVMELAEGNLRQLLQNAPAGGPVPGAERMLAEICDGLAHMHEFGWVHGDLKPGNVLVMGDGSVRLADFGLTVQVEGTHAYAPRIGSSDYLPPEWWTERVGEQGLPVRTTADIWAFGVLAHQVLTGGLYPFPGATYQARSLAAQAFATGAAPLRLDERIPAPWRSLITDCLSPDHATRSAHGAASLSARIRTLPADALSGRALRRVRTFRRSRVLIAAATLAALAGASFGGYELAQSGGSANKASINRVSTSASPAIVGQLLPGAPVPAQYRSIITKAALMCASNDVTPALLAAIIKAETNFDPSFSDAATVSYGIVGWTPSIFKSWESAPTSDYMNPTDAIRALSQYLCWVDQGLDQAGVAGNRTELLGAAFASSRKSVIDARGVPSWAKPFAASVAQYAKEYSG